jgi:hypothetical protein
LALASTAVVFGVVTWTGGEETMSGSKVQVHSEMDIDPLGRIEGLLEELSRVQVCD